MSCIVPITTSPGRLDLLYQDVSATHIHRLGWNFIAGVDITNHANVDTEAQRLGALLTDCLPSFARLLQWEIILPGGGVYDTGALSGLGPGTHAQNTQMQNWNSTTVAFVGHAHPLLPGYCAGRTVTRLHTWSCLNFVPGSQFFVATGDAPFLAFITAGLNASTYLPADKYGQQADIQPNMPVQWNAHTQKKEGS